MFFFYPEFVFIRHQDPVSSLFIFYLAAITTLDLVPIWTKVLNDLKKKYSKVENLKAYWKCNPSGEWVEFVSDTFPPRAGAWLKLLGPQRLESHVISAARAIVELGLNLGLVLL